MKATQMIQNQNGFTLIELMVVAVILAIISAIAVPIYIGYKKEAMTQEAYESLTQIADVCIGKATKAKEMNQTGDPTVSALVSGQYFDYDTTPACTLKTSTFTATGKTGAVKDLKLIVKVNMGDATAKPPTPPTKTYLGDLY